MVRKLLYLNGLAALSVVLYHSGIWGYTVMFFQPPGGEANFSQVGSADYFGLLMIDQLAIFAIPTFIFVSGYFLAIATAQNSKTVEWGTILSRVRMLVIPFLIWSVLMLAFKMLQGVRYTPFDFFYKIVTGKLFYFVPLLIQLYILAPLLVLLVRRRTKTVLVASAILQILVLLFRYVTFFRPGWELFEILSSKKLFTAYIFWFILGIVVGINLAYVKTILARHKMLFLTGIFVFYFVGAAEGEAFFRLSDGWWRAETLIDQMYALFVVLSFLSFEKIQFPLFEQISSLGVRSYGIYLTNEFTLTATAKFLYRFFPSVMEYQILFQPILILSGLGFSLLLMYFVEKTPLSKYYRYLFG